MAYKSKETYKKISDLTGFPVNSVKEIDDLTIHGEYSLRQVANKYLSKIEDIQKVINLLTEDDLTRLPPKQR